MDPQQINNPAQSPSMSQPVPPVQDVNANIASPTSTVQAQPIETPIETPVDAGIQIEGYEPPPNDGVVSEPPPPPTGKFNKRVFFIMGSVVFIILILIILLVIVLRPKKTDDRALLTYWGLWEDPVVMQSVIDDYQAQNPNVTIQYSMQSPIEYRQRLQAAIERGEGPDIYRFHNTWVPMFIKDLAPIPSDVMSIEEYRNTFYPVVQEDLMVNNKFVGIPLSIDGLVLFYNAQLLDEAGVAIPTTWEDFEKATQAMTIKDSSGKLLLAGAALGTAENVEHFSDIIGLIMYQNTANPDKVVFPSLESDEAKLALEYYTLFAQKPYNIWDADQDNSVVAFASGKVAFIFAPTWQVFSIQALNPDLVFGVAPVPQLKGAQKANWASYWVEGVSAISKNKAEAFAFLKYLSSKEVMTKLFTDTAKTRSFGNPYSRVDLADEMSSNNFLAPIADQAPTMKSWYMASRTKDEGINDKIIGYFRNAVNAIYDGSSAGGELPTVANGINEVLSEYGLSAP